MMNKTELNIESFVKDYSDIEDRMEKFAENCVEHTGIGFSDAFIYFMALSACKCIRYMVEDYGWEYDQACRFVSDRMHSYKETYFNGVHPLIPNIYNVRQQRTGEGNEET